MAVASGVLLGLGGCARARVAEQAGAEYRLADVEIAGNEAISDKEIVEYLNLQPTKWFPLPKRRWFLEGYVPVDTQRIEDLYATRGYFDARVLDVRVEPHDVFDAVDLTFEVVEGDPTLVTEIDFVWPEGFPTGPKRRQASKEAIQRNCCELEVGKPFDVQEMHDSEAAIQMALRERGYAWAEVEGTAEVDRVARTAKVRYAVEPGPYVKIGDIRIDGLQTVPRKPVQNEVDRFEGKVFSPSRLDAIEDAIYGIGTFSAVTVEPAKRPDGRTVDLMVHVRESDPQLVKVGVGIGFESNRWEQFVGLRYTHANLFRTLTQLELESRVGYAELPSIFNLEEHGPVFLVEPTFRKKGLLEKQLIWTLTPSFEVGIQEGYQYYTPKTRIGVSRFFTRFVETGIAHNFSFFDFFNVSPTLEENETILGRDFRDPFLLSYMSFDLYFHITDELVEPDNGVVFGATYDLAGGIFGGDYDYHRITPEVRGYWTPIKERLQFALKAETGIILPFGDEPGAPIVEKYYLGGANDVRGWGIRRLSPWVVDCNREGDDCDRVPVGGQTMLMGSFETRVRTWNQLWAAAFFDVGDVQAEVLEYRPRELNYSIGPGLRYVSPVGTIRLDVGVRLNETGRFPGQPRWALHLGLGEAF